MAGLLVVFNLLIIAFLVVSNINIYSEARETRQQYATLNRQIKELQGRNEELKEMFSFVSEDGISEEYLRDRGLYKREGEHVVVITRDEPASTEEELAFPEEKKSASLLDKVVSFFQAFFGRPQD